MNIFILKNIEYENLIVEGVGWFMYYSCRINKFDYWMLIILCYCFNFDFDYFIAS